MKNYLSKLIVTMTLMLCVIPAIAQFPEYKSLNGTYTKIGKDYKIEAKIDFNGIPYDGTYFDESGEEVSYSKYYGYIKLISGDHQEGFDIVNVIPAGDGPIFMLAPWQFPRTMMVYPNFYDVTLQMVTDGDPVEPYLGEILKKAVKSPAKKAPASSSRKKSTPKRRR